MMTPAEIRDAVDNRLALLWAAVQSRQSNYAAAHSGHYWQGLLTHSVTPADGAQALPDVGPACPSDQRGQPWPAAILTTAIEMAVQIDSYGAPDGDGYQTTVYVSIAGITWTRTAQVGPETWRAQGWAPTVAAEAI